MKRTASS
jgi:aurora kinase, other